MTSNRPAVTLPAGRGFFFYSNEGNEPAHIHVDYRGPIAKFWLTPVALANSAVGWFALPLRKCLAHSPSYSSTSPSEPRETQYC